MVLRIRIRIKLEVRIRIRIKVISWIRTRIRIKNNKLDPHPHQFADDKPECMEYEPTCHEHFFKVLSLYLKARIRIRIRIRNNVMRIRNTA